MPDYDYQKVVDDINGTIRGGMKTNLAPPTTDPDSIENLLTQVLTMAFDIKDAMGAMRHSLLGPWVEEASDTPSNQSQPSGLIPQSRNALYKLIDTQREIREHIVAISKGVR